MRRLIRSSLMLVISAGVTLAGQTAAAIPETPANHFAQAKIHYAERRLTVADREIAEGLGLMRQERASHASDPLPSVPDGAPYPVGGLVAEPVRRNDVAPKFSDSALLGGATGIVTLEFVVNSDGKVDQIRVLDSVRYLDEAAKTAAKQWRFDPPVVNGRPAAVVTVAAMSFTWRTDPMPADYLEMARFYYEHRHYARAEGLLDKARTAIRAEAAAFGATPQAGPARVILPAFGQLDGASQSSSTSPVEIAVGSIREPRKLKDVAPVYPKFAIAARIQGRLVVDAIIDVDGRVKGVRVIKSVPPLDQAAVDAVRRWEYAPALVDGTPVEVIMSVTVIFILR